MICIYEVNINNRSIHNNLQKMLSKIYKLLPMREEGKDWIKPLETIVVELVGMSSLFPDQETLLSLVCKLQGMLVQKDDSDFFLFRRVIFECCSLIGQLQDEISLSQEKRDYVD